MSANELIEIIKAIFNAIKTFFDSIAIVFNEMM